MATRDELRTAAFRTAARLGRSAEIVREMATRQAPDILIETQVIKAIGDASDYLRLARFDSARAAFGLPEPRATGAVVGVVADEDDLPMTGLDLKPSLYDSGD